MSVITKTLSALFAFGFASVCCADEFPPVRDAVECTPRNGLPNFLAKLEKGGEVRVAYLGGSITAQEGWRVKSLAYFQKLHPNAKLKEINAAIGGTGSNLGVLRIDHDVFAAKPDLLFVEFAVNDGNSVPLKYMEGIVRKTWKAFPDCDICFVYTMTSADFIMNAVRQGKLWKSSSTMEEIADRYGIPTIFLGSEVVRLEKEGKLVMRAEKDMTQVSGKELDKVAGLTVNKEGKIPFAPDGVHPYSDTGHQLYEEAIERSMGPITEASKAAGPHKLVDPIDPNNLERSVMLPVDKATLEGSWTKLPATESLGRQFSNRVDAMWKGEPGATLSFKFKGSSALLYNLLGPGCGKIEISVDGKTRTTNNIDPYCTYYRLGLCSLAENLDPEKVHEVSVKVLADKLDKEKILFEHNRPDMAKNPAKYEPNDFYLGAIFIAGELVDAK